LYLITTGTYFHHAKYMLKENTERVTPFVKQKSVTN